jgi:hypothetical protein
MSRIFVATAVAALVAGLVFGSPETAEGRDSPAVQATPGGEGGRSSRFLMDSCPCDETPKLNWQPPFKSRPAPNLDRKRAHGLFAAWIAARTWGWSAWLR